MILLWEDWPNSYESAICGFLVGEITINLCFLRGPWYFLREKDFAQKGLDGYFWDMEKLLW